MIWRVLVVVILQTACCTAGIVLKDGGAEPVDSSDIAIKFYMQIRNEGTSQSRITLRLNQCCLHMHDGKHNCELMKDRVVEGNMTFVSQPKQLVSFTFLYPTMYPADRKGECHVVIDEAGNIHKYHLSFDTTLPRIHYIPSFLQNWITGVSNCDSVDEDRLAQCHPVNCVLKYHGLNNYFNTTSRLCEPTVECVPDMEKPVPNKVYDRKRNLCKQLDSAITAKEIADLKYKETEHPIYSGYNPLHVEHFVCVHGYERADGSGCECYTGWMSAPQERPSYQPLSQTYYMCNIKVLDYIAKQHPQASLIALAVLGVVNLVMIIVLVLVVINEQKASKAVRDRADRVRSSASLRSIPQRKVSSVYSFAKVHTPHQAEDGSEFDLDMGDIVTHLRRTDDDENEWQGECRGATGTFPGEIAEFYTTMPPEQAASTDSDEYEQLWENPSIQRAKTS